MSRHSQLAAALDSSLTELQRGESSLEAILRQYPGVAEQLRPLLVAADAVSAHGAPLGPTQQFRTQSKARLMRRLEARSRIAGRRATPRLLPRLRPALALGAVLLVVVLLGGSVGVAYASDAALPGDTLYGVKLGLEELALGITPSAAGDTRLLLRQADRRLEELTRLLESSRSDQLGSVVEGYRSALNQALQRSQSDIDGLEAVEAALIRQELALTAVLEEAPEQAAPAIEAALVHAQHGRSVVEQLQSGASPSELAPGQQKKSGDDQSGNLPPGQDSRTEGQNGLIPPGQLKKNACDPDRPGQGSQKRCADQ